MELKIIGKISLENFERKPKKRRPETYAPEIKGKMESLARFANERFGDIAGPDGRIRMKSEDDIRYVSIKEGAWAKEQGLGLEEYRQKQESSNSSLAEQAVTLSLAKVLGDRFLSLRSSAWDDYENGVDNLLFDTKTGSLICGFDEVIEGYGQDGSDKKEEKVMRKFRQGGARAKYGLELTSANPISINISEQWHLPTFYISLNKEELSDLLEGVCQEKIGEAEKKVLGDLVASLEQQLGKMKGLSSNIPAALAQNLRKSQVFVDSLKEKL